MFREPSAFAKATADKLARRQFKMRNGMFYLALKQAFLSLFKSISKAERRSAFARAFGSTSSTGSLRGNSPQAGRVFIPVLKKRFFNRSDF